jgi:two-component system OmpR family response regulator
MTSILIVEDDPDLSELMAITLRTAGYASHIARDGAEALLALRQFRHDLLVVDIMLPDIVGLSLCERIRRDPAPELAQIPILIASACPESETRPLAIAAGADDFLSKPFSPYQLSLRIHALLAQTAHQRIAC